jgi:hypothetical protein
MRTGGEKVRRTRDREQEQSRKKGQKKNDMITGNRRT